MYEPVDPKVSFPKMEEDIVRFWESGRIFEKSISQREGKDEFVFYDGPPFATGLPHFGHFVPGTIKDIIPRYKAMRGFKVERRFGWDCHGLPVENLIEKELGLGLEDRHRRIRHSQLQRGLPGFGPPLREGMADDHDAGRPLGRLRPRLQDDGSRLHGVHLVGRSTPLGQGPHIRGPLHPPLLPALLHRALQPRARPGRLQGRPRPGDHHQVQGPHSPAGKGWRRSSRRAARPTSSPGRRRPGPCPPTSASASAPISTTSS